MKPTDSARPVFLLLSALLLLAGCGQLELESDGRQAAVRYFYGEKAHDGYMLFTWKDAEREAKTRQKRHTLGLDDDWEYWDEQIDVISLGDLDYFISYALTFKNRRTDQLFIREEKFFSADEKNWQPILLMQEYFRSDPHSGKIESLRVETF